MSTREGVLSGAMQDVKIMVDGGREVPGILAAPRAMRALLALAHGAGAGMRHRFMEAMTGVLAERRIGTLRYQFPYMEAGKKRPDPQRVLLATVRAAVELAGAHARGRLVLAGGKSMGGRMTSLAAAGQPLPNVGGLVFLGFPLHAPGKVGSERADHLGDVKLPLLFVQGTRDRLADLALLRPIVGALAPRARLHVVDGGDHSFGVPKRSARTPEDVMAEVGDAVASFVDGIG